jgi:hypothetical protein
LATDVVTVFVGDVAVTVVVEAGAVAVTVVVAGGRVEVSPCFVMVTFAVFVVDCVCVIVWVKVVSLVQALRIAIEPTAALPAIRLASFKNSRRVNLFLVLAFSSIL